ncbi:MAG: hypothetical protein P1P65_08305 [Treponema sp.]
MHFIIKTEKTKNEVLQIIRDNTRIKNTVLDISKGDKYFEGKIFEDSFKIRRIMRYRNSFLPIIIGKIEETDSGSKIKIKMRMNGFVIGFISLWFTVVIISCIAMFLAMLLSTFNRPSGFIPFIMFFFGILIVIIPNKIEVKKGQEKLQALLK